MAARRGTFSFDLSRPLKKGTLLKQGGLHRAFKNREFILYPGFLVYYDSENKWRLDLTKGETLGGRLGAVKLKGATVGIARNVPRAVKFGIMLTAPDPANKRQTYLMNASSKEERDSWIEAIHKATPTSPHMNHKDNSSAEHKPKPQESKPASNEKSVLPPPPYALRQDTACEAAIAVASCTDEQEERKEIEGVMTSIDGSLRETEAFHRHNTATLAAISLGAADQPMENEETEHETSIDVILGQTDVSSEDDSSSCLSSTPEAASPTPNVLSPADMSPVPEDNPEKKLEEKFLSPEPDMPDMMSPDMSPAPEEATEMDTDETVESGNNVDGESTVTTMVTVACPSRGQSSNLERREEGGREAGKVNGVEDDEGEESDDSGEKRGRSTSVTHILVTDSENTTLSMNLNNYDSDDTLSDEDSHEYLPGIVENGTKIEPPSPKHSPVTAIKKLEVRPGSSSSHGSNASSESNDAVKLAAPANRERRSSTPFVEKKGYLYKMGGQRKTWKLRYFILRPGAFNYFKDSKSRKPLGEVKLKNVNIFFPGIGERKQSFQFTMHTESSWNKRADWVFAGQSEREMKEWIAAFKGAAGKISAGSGDSD